MDRRISQPIDVLFASLSEKFFIKPLRNVGFNMGVYVTKSSPKTHINPIEFAGIVFLRVGQDALAEFFLNEIRDFPTPGMR